MIGLSLISRMINQFKFKFISYYLSLSLSLLSLLLFKFKFISLLVFLGLAGGQKIPVLFVHLLSREELINLNWFCF